MVQDLLHCPWHTQVSGESTREKAPRDVTRFLICCSFTEAIVKAMKGESGVIEPTYVYLPGVSGGDAIHKETGCEYFSVPVELGPEGAKHAENVVSKANDYEKKLLQKCYEGLKGNIEKGIEFVKNPPQK